MRLTHALVVSSALMVCLSARAASTGPAKDFGLGLTLGSLLAVNGKYWLSKQGALSFGVGSASAHWTILYGEYLWHIPGLFGSHSKFGRETSAYFGGGGGLGFWNGNDGCGRWRCDWDRSRGRSGTGAFVRGLFGFEWYPLRTRFGVFGELGPSIMLTPETGGTLDIDIGGRYYF